MQKVSLGQQPWRTCCFFVTLCCLLFAGGCASQQGRNSTLSFSVPQTGNAKSLTANEKTVLHSTGQLDRNIPVQSMEDVTRQYTYFLRQGRGTMAVVSKRAEKYLAYSRKVFQEHGMPDELAYLAIVESGYRADAKSPAGAAGAWQFMPFTGEKYALSQDWWTDERLDPYEATEAAATYLQKLYDRFGDWPTAIAAYNAGEGKIGRALQGTGSYNFFELRARNHMLDDKAQLREETKQYVPRFLAITKIMRNLPQLGFDDIHPENAQEVVRLKARPGTDLQGLAQACHVEWEHFNAMNMHHKRRVTDCGRETYVYVPEGREREAKAFLDSSVSTAFANWGPSTITANSESWDKISRRCAVPVSQLKALNPDVSRMRAGDTLLLPRSANIPDSTALALGKKPVQRASDLRSSRQTSSRNTLQQHPAGVVHHTVQAGETLASISRKYNMGIGELQSHNGIADPHALRAGDVLRIPEKKRIPLAESRFVAGLDSRISRTATPSRRQSEHVSSKKNTYTVQANDNLWRIARTHGVSVEDLKRWNGVDEKNLRVGSKLVVEQ